MLEVSETQQKAMSDALEFLEQNPEATQNRDVVFAKLRYQVEHHPQLSHYCLFFSEAPFSNLAVARNNLRKYLPVDRIGAHLEDEMIVVDAELFNFISRPTNKVKMANTFKTLFDFSISLTIETQLAGTVVLIKK